MEKILSKELKFKHIISKNGESTKKTNSGTRRIVRELDTSNSRIITNNTNSNNSTNNSIRNNISKTITPNDAYVKEIVSRMNIINEELYDYIVFECGYKNSSNEYKKEIKSHLDEIMMSFFKKMK